MAIVVHKWAEGLTLGLLYKKEGFKRSTIIIMNCLAWFKNLIPNICKHAKSSDPFSRVNKYFGPLYWEYFDGER